MTVTRYSTSTWGMYGFVALALCQVLGSSGCGTTKQATATEQLILSDAVDGAVAKIDFTPLRGQKVYFDTEYLKNPKGVGFVNAEYVISSMRQQMIAAGLLLQEKKDTADFILEGRIGALGADSHEVVYGIPSTGALNDAADAVAAFSRMPSVPGIPELAIAKRGDQSGAAKLSVFAYEAESRARVWQSGISTGRSTAKDMWILGAGPFQRGTIHDGNVKFAGSSVDVPLLDAGRSGANGPIASYRKSLVFDSLESSDIEGEVGDSESEIQQVSGEATTVSDEEK